MLVVLKFSSLFRAVCSILCPFRAVCFFVSKLQVFRMVCSLLSNFKFSSVFRAACPSLSSNSIYYSFFRNSLVCFDRISGFHALVVVERFAPVAQILQSLRAVCSLSANYLVSFAWIAPGFSNSPVVFERFVPCAQTPLCSQIF